jgi:hypothetical protein
MNHRVLRCARILAIAALVAVLAPGRAEAAPLGLNTSSPDIMAYFLDFQFDSEGGLCGEDDFTLCYSADEAWIESLGLDPELVEFDVPYQLGAAIDPLTGDLLHGTFSLGQYLTGTLTAFGYSFTDASGPDGLPYALLEFLVAITGGSLASAFGPTMGVIGVVHGWDAPRDGMWNQVQISDDAITDNFRVSINEPASLLLLSVGFFGISAAQRRRRKQGRQ